MNKSSEQIKAMTQKLFKAQSGTLPVKKLHPKRDWMIGILIGFCITAVVSTWSAYMYIANRDGGTTEIEVTITNPSYQAALVDQALKIFEARAANFSSNKAVMMTPAEDIADKDVVAGTEPITATSNETSSVVSEEDEVTAVPENEPTPEAVVVESGEPTEGESSLGAPIVSQ
jgi:hypothetical protein